MKILFLNHNVKGKGTFIRCFHFAKHLIQLGHTVVILTSKEKNNLSVKKEIIEGVEVISMPDFLPRRFRNGGLGPIDTVLRCLYLMFRHFDIVENFDHRPVVLYPALVSKYLMKTPLVSEWTDLHGTGGSLNNRPTHVQKLIRPYEDYTEKKSKLIAEKLVVISKGLKHRAIQLGISKSRIVLIPGGADVDNVFPSQKKEARKTIGLPLDKKIIAYTASTHYDRNLFLRSINIILKERKDVILVTTGAMLRHRDRQALNQSERIIELGFLPYEKYAKFLPSVDVFLFPYTNRSLNTGRWPNKIGDYMAAGRPVVSNPTGDIRDLFEKHQIGLLADERPEDMAQKVIRILSNEQLAFKLGQNSRKTAENYYDWKILTKRLEKCFLDLVKT